MLELEDEKFIVSINGLTREYLPSLKSIYPSKDAYESMIHAAEYIAFCKYDGLRISYKKIERITLDIRYLTNTPEGFIFFQVIADAQQGEIAYLEDIDFSLKKAYKNNDLKLPFNSLEVRLI